MGPDVPILWVAKMKILHVIPDSAVQPRFYYSGSTKDILGRTEYFASRSIEVEQIVIKRSDDLLLESLHSMPVEEFSTVFLEFLVYPLSMRYIRQRKPSTRIYCRSINAELYHKFHLYLSNVRDQHRDGVSVMGASFANLHLIKKSLANFRKDLKCGRLSDAVLSITDWESRHYWQYFVGNRTETLPYYLPDVYASEIRAIKAEKENICVAFMGVDVKQGSFLADSLYNFTRLVREMQNDLVEWSFQVTGAVPEKYTRSMGRIDVLGFAETPYPILARSKAVAIMSSYGLGFKTKILEAILAGCYVLLPRQLHKRLPQVVKPFCIEVDLNSVESFMQALKRCNEPFPSEDPNNRLKQDAFLTLDRLFL